MKMKKFASMILALVMILALAVPSMADNSATWTTGGGNTDISVTATYAEGSADTPSEVYSVDISWGITNSLKYTANAASYSWSATKMQYEKTPGTGGAWTGEAKVTITVTNKSNKDIVADLTISQTKSLKTMTWSESKSSATIQTAAPADYTDTAVKTANTETFTATIVPEDDAAITSTGAEVAKVTVEISAGTTT